MRLTSAKRAFTYCQSAFALLGIAAGTTVLAPRTEAAPTGTIHYEVSIANLTARKFRVAMTIHTNDKSANKSFVTLAIPAWAPGYYQILNFQRDISNFHALDAKGRTLAVNKPNDLTWTVMGGGSTVYATYDVTAKDAGYGFFGSHLDEETGYINGASALMYVEGGKTLPQTIAYHAPKAWKIVSSLDPISASTTPTSPKPKGAKSKTTDATASVDTVAAYRAGDYDELIDCPMQMGQFEKLDFTVKGTPYAAILVGASKLDRAGMISMLTKVGEAGQNVFGYAPFKRYHFIYHFKPGNFGGGLEHRNCTVLNVWHGLDEFPAQGTSLVAHEYFHAWNVKRLHPAVLGPFDYTQKVRTGALWFCEGVTDYYASILPRMAGLETPEAFRNEMSNRIQQLQHTEARKRISAEEASQKAWEGGSMGFGGLSYYLKGSLLGLALDVKIRAATDNGKSLDDVMRLLDEQYGKKAVGYPEDGLLRAINQVSGDDFEDFYRRYVQGTEEIPWNDILRMAGLEYQEGVDKLPYLGVTSAVEKGGLKVKSVVTDSAADKAGLKEGDQIVTVNGERIDPAQFQKTIRGLHPNQRAVFGLRRDNNALEVALSMGVKEEPYRRMIELPDADDRAKRVRAGLYRMVTP